MNKVFWLQPEDTQLGSWQRQIEQVTGSKSFCVLPWIHLATRPNGDMRICCVANVRYTRGKPTAGRDLPFLYVSTVAVKRQCR